MLESQMSVIDYGTGRISNRRRTWLAVLALLIPCVLIGLMGLTYAVYAAEPPPYSGTNGLGWVFEVGAMYGFLFLGTVFGTPISIVLAIFSILLVRAAPTRYGGMYASFIAIVLDVALIIAVPFFRYALKGIP